MLSLRTFLVGCVITVLGQVDVCRGQADEPPQSAPARSDEYYSKNKDIVRFEGDFWDTVGGTKRTCHVRFYKTSPIIIPGNNFCTVEVLPKDETPIRHTLYGPFFANEIAISQNDAGGATLTAGQLTFTLSAKRIKLVRDEFYEDAYKDSVAEWEAAADSPNRCLNLASVHRSYVPYDYILERLSKLEGLKRLEVGFPVSDDGLAALGKVASLEELSIGRDWTKDASLAELVNLPVLRKLRIGNGYGTRNRKAKRDLIESLSKLQSLEVLEFTHAPIVEVGTKDALAPLKKLSKLRELHLYGADVDDAGLRNLSEIPSLKQLNVGHAENISREAIYEFRRKRPDCKLIEYKTWRERSERQSEQQDSYAVALAAIVGSVCVFLFALRLWLGSKFRAGGRIAVAARA
jgi:hypothetical protein